MSDLSPASDSDVPVIYAIRIMPRAEKDIAIAVARFTEIENELLAKEWQEGLFKAVASLATMPRRYALIAEKSRFRLDVRQLLYRRPRSSVAYRILYIVEDKKEEGPTVSLVHIRHASSRSITRSEAREIETQNQ